MSIDKCVQNALKRLSCQHSNTVLNEKECEIYVWPQTWSDASCGNHDVFSAQVITSAPTVVILGPTKDACIYHGGDFAYKIDQVNETFWTCLDDRNMPSKHEYKKEHKNAI